jgi:hypothetical protein
MNIDHISTQEALEEVSEELRRRERVYPFEVSKGRMTEAQVEHGIAAMKAAKCKLERLMHQEQGQTELF